VERALAYAAEYADEIEAAIAANDAAFERVEPLHASALRTPVRRPRRAPAPR